MATGRALPSSLKYFVFSLIAALMIREKVEKQLLYGPAHLGKNEEGQERLAALIPLKMSLSLRTRAGCGKCIYRSEFHIQRRIRGPYSLAELS